MCEAKQRGCVRHGSSTLVVRVHTLPAPLPSSAAGFGLDLVTVINILSFLALPFCLPLAWGPWGAWGDDWGPWGHPPTQTFLSPEG